MQVDTFDEAVSLIENTGGHPHKMADVIEGMDNANLSDDEWCRLFELINRLFGIWQLKNMPNDKTIH